MAASVRNAFALLGAAGGGEPTVAGSGKAAKKKAKKKAASGAAITEQQAPKQQAIKKQEAAPVQPAREEPRVQSSRDAGEALEAAAVAAAAGELGNLACDWAEQMVRDDSLFTDGKDLVDFKHVLVKSRALEALVESCCARGRVTSEARPLAQLLGAVAHPSVPSGLAPALAEAAASMGQLAAADPLAPVGAAKRAAATALGLLKKGMPKPPATKPVEAPATKLRRLGGELGRQEARLGGASQPKELCKVYASILELLCGQVDVLRPGGGAPPPPEAPELAAALRSLEELRAAMEARLKEVQAPPKPQLSVAQQVAEAEAAHKKEEAATAARLSEVESRIASLEAELAALKSEAADLKERRASAADHHRRRVDSIRSGKPAVSVSPAQAAAALQGGLGAFDGLAAAVRAGGAAAAAGAAVGGADVASLSAEVVAAEVPVKLLGAMQQVMELNLVQLADLGGKARFYRERLDKAVKQGEQAAKLGVGDPKIFQTQRATAEKNLQEVVSSAEATAAACRAAVASYRERLPVMLNLPSFMPPPPEYLTAMDSRVAEADTILEGIKKGTYVPPAPAAPAAEPAAAAPAGGLAAAAGAARVPAAVAPAAGSNLTALEQRLAALEAESVKKDAQIAAMVSSATLDVPSPLAGRTSMPPAMLSSPTNNKPIGPAAPIAPAAAPAPTAVGPAVPSAPISFSQALAAGVPTANGRAKAARPRRA